MSWSTASFRFGDDWAIAVLASIAIPTEAKDVNQIREQRRRLFAFVPSGIIAAGFKIVACTSATPNPLRLGHSLMISKLADSIALNP
jgi:hypothetical protein